LESDRRHAPMLTADVGQGSTLLHAAGTFRRLLQEYFVGVRTLTFVVPDPLL
jgi:hypothetical protein